MKHILHRDYETRSVVDLQAAGTHAYMEHATTDVWCCAYAVDEGPVKLWVPGDPVPDEFVEAAENPDWLAYAHNAAFERLAEHYIMAPRYGWPEIPLERQRCTMVMAHAMALPGSLENAARALGLDVQKDTKGRALMLQMCRPRKGPDPKCSYCDGTGEFYGNLGLACGCIQWWDEPEKRERLYTYCQHDVEVERSLHKRLVPLTPSELALWHLDQSINDRGVYVDVAMCESAKRIVKATAERLDKEMARVTEQRVTACSQVQKLLEFVKLRGVDATSLSKDTLTDILVRDDLPADVRRALELRRQAAKASVSKINALMAGKSSDGRSKMMLQFHAASTGRWAGRRFQPQNLMRPEDGFDVDQAVEAILVGDLDVMDMMYEEPISAVANCIRGTVISAPGTRFVTADFANIEGRGIAWLAGERWKLDAFRAYDAGTGPDLYKVAAGGIFGVPPSEIGKDSRRQIGKVSELALGYQGGPAAFRTMAKTYGLKIEEYFDIVMEAADPRFVDEAHEAWDAYGKSSGIAKRAWLPAEVVKRAWRHKHPRIVCYWQDLENAAIEAVEHPGKVVPVLDEYGDPYAAPVKFRVAGSFLWLLLPSGRPLCYPYPKLVEKATSWGTTKRTLQYMGVDSRTHKWGEQYTYGGKLAENVTQAIARDVLADSMVRLEAAGYPIVLTVHDEVVAERALGEGSLEEFERIMGEVPAWAAGLPIAVEGWEGTRYRK
ncbi:DNA polymerase [Chelatococcus caeni]|uniref:DNA-directed DNA polymerase n=1 Tax=Chelatococcus caeni TaxID=1348468 RepID=A0A840C3W1_9HYPH|nr:DNA polymerase [Chelatococcus caeni]MBB4017626.1 DNA polymerase [Chelatococcus caeni]